MTKFEIYLREQMYDIPTDKKERIVNRVVRKYQEIARDKILEVEKEYEKR